MKGNINALVFYPCIKCTGFYVAKPVHAPRYSSTNYLNAALETFMQHAGVLFSKAAKSQHISMSIRSKHLFFSNASIRDEAARRKK